MSNHNTSLTELKKLWHNVFYVRCIHYHGVIYACESFYFVWNRLIRVNKCTELIGYFSIFNLNGTNLDNLVIYGAKSCCLQIKYNITSIQTLTFGISYHIFNIIHEVSLYSVYNLKVKRFPFILILYTLQGMKCLRESLNYSMVGNGNGLMSPGNCPFYKVFGTGYTVHVTHFRMAVKLHPFFNGSVHPLGCKVSNLLDSHNRCNSKLIVETVHSSHTFKLDKASFADRR